jgi:Prp8 binding protein
MLLSGHADAVLTMRFNPTGDVIASGSHDKTILLWRTYGECENFLVLRGHKNAVLEVHWTQDGEGLISCSPDKTVRAWDAETSEEIARFSEHAAVVNSCCPLRRGPPLVVSVSDDCTARLWDLRERNAVRDISERYPLTSVSFSEGGDQIYTSGIENVVRVWDLRTEQPVYTMEGHSDTVTGMRLNAAGTHLLTNSMDNTVRSWDVRPYAPKDRCVAVYTGHQHGFERNLLRCDWSSDGKRVTAGSANRMVYVWNAKTAQIEYALPGHTGSVNEVVFHPSEPVVGSCSSDKTIYLGELVE